jgi:hypothetical protein
MPSYDEFESITAELGSLALGLFLITTCVVIATGSSWVISPIRSIIVGDR